VGGGRGPDPLPLAGADTGATGSRGGGMGRTRDGKTAEAVASFDRALTLEAALEEARLNRAIARLRLADPAAARADLEAIWANEASRHRAEAAYHNGIALDRLGRPAQLAGVRSGDDVGGNALRLAVSGMRATAC